MDDLPKRIWAWLEIDDGGVQKFWISNPKKVDGSEKEYLRSDHVAALLAEERRKALEEAHERRDWKRRNG